MTKSRTKKTLIIGITSLLLGSLLVYKISTDYRFARSLHMPTFIVQKTFWNHDATSGNFLNQADVSDFNFNGGGAMESPIGYDFTLDLNDQYKAEYSNYFDRNPNRDYKDVFNILVTSKSDNSDIVPIFDFWVYKKDFKVNNEFSPSFATTTEAQKKERDARMAMPEVKKEIKELKKLAIQRLKEVQDKYYKSNK